MTRTPQQESLRSNRGELLAALGIDASTVRGNAVRCPFHDDRIPSASVKVGDDGAWRFHCHGPCKWSGDVFDVRARKNGRTVDDELSAVREPAITPRKTARIFPDLHAIEASIRTWMTFDCAHVYTNPGTLAIDLVVVRAHDANGEKNFTQYRPAIGGFTPGAPPKPWPLYNRTYINNEPAVVVVEGEKCVEALRRVGVAATTSPCGAGKAACADWSPLAGKTCFLWPDADQPNATTGKRTGIEHMREVAAILQRLEPPTRVYWLDPDRLGLPDKGDAVDYVARLDPSDDIAAAVWNLLEETATPMGCAQELTRLIEDTIAGKRKSLDWPHTSLSKLSKSLFPGTITLICGDPSSGKSFLVTDAMIHWHNAGVKFACYMLEDSLPEYQLRILAQISGHPDVTDDTWVRGNADFARQLNETFTDHIEAISRRIETAGEKHPTVDELAAWVESKSIAGNEILIIDPITYADFSDRPWADDKRFMHSVRWALKNSGARLILVTHPRKASAGGKTTGALDDMAGGTAYPRHAQTVLWVHRKDPPEDVNIVTPGAPTVSREVDRVVRISKARNGKGTGCSIGFQFEKLRFSEQGLIESVAKPKRVTPQPVKAPRFHPVANPFD